MKDVEGQLDEILKRLLADVDDDMEFLGTVFNPKDHAQTKVTKSLEASKQALLELMKGAVPKEYETDKDWLHKVATGEKSLEEINAEDNRFKRGFNACVAQTLKNLGVE